MDRKREKERERWTDPRRGEGGGGEGKSIEPSHANIVSAVAVVTAS